MPGAAVVPAETLTAESLVLDAVRPSSALSSFSAETALSKVASLVARVRNVAALLWRAFCWVWSVVSGWLSCFITASRTAVKSMLLNPLNVIGDPMVGSREYQMEKDGGRSGCEIRASRRQAYARGGTGIPGPAPSSCLPEQ